LTSADDTVLLAPYERMAEASGRMRRAAIEGDWEALIAAEGDCARLAEGIRTAGSAPPGSESGRARRIALLRAMLDDDAEIRRHTQPWMRRLEQLLGGHGMRRRLREAYG